MNLEDTLLAIRRFVARHGLPTIIWSGNFKTFIFSSKKLVLVYGVLCPKWNFIVPSSPWWGGWWERLVRSVKTALRKSVGRYSLTFVALETILYEIEGCINSRPLTFTSDDFFQHSPLTPLNFVIGRSHIHEQDQINREVPPSTNKDSLIEQDYYLKSVMDLFWTRWSDEYIRSLPPYRGSGKICNIKEGSFVLIHQDNKKRSIWPLGVVMETFKGNDGVVRSCQIKTKTGLFMRPNQKLYHLEIEDGSLNDIIIASSNNSNVDMFNNTSTVSDTVSDDNTSSN